MHIHKPLKEIFLFQILFPIFLMLTWICSGFAFDKAGEQHQGTNRNKPSSLHNGIYAVLREAFTPEKAQCPGLPCTVLRYDKKYTDSGPGEPVKYVAIDTVSFVPLVLEAAPETKKDSSGKTVLSGTLQKEHAKTLETFTRVHLGGEIGIVVDGEIVTLHKIRSVISGGQFQITRCTDNACEVLRDKLTK